MVCRVASRPVLLVLGPGAEGRFRAFAVLVSDPGDVADHGGAAWTVGLLLQALIISWCLGNLLGALAGYFRSNLLLKLSGAVVMALHPVPTYILGLVLLLFGFVWPAAADFGRGADEPLQPFPLTISAR